MKKTYLLTICFLLTFLFFSSILNAAEVIKIGILFPFTGPLAKQGNDQFTGVDIAREMLNNAGGLWGKKIEFVKGDTTTNEAAVAEAERLITVEGAKLIIGTYSSSRSMAASNTTEKHKVIFWEVNAIADELTQRGFKYYFRANVKSTDYGLAAVPFLFEMVGPALKKDAKKLRIATTYEDSLYGTITADAFTKLGKEKGLNFVGEFPFTSGIVDLSSTIMKLKALKPDVLFIVPYVKDMILFWRQSKELNFDVPILIGGGTVGESGVAEGLGGDIEYVCNAYLPTGCNPKALTPEARKDLEEFEKIYQKKFAIKPPILAITGFANTNVLFRHVLPKAGSLDPEAVRKAALAVDIPEGGTALGFGVKFNPPEDKMAGHNAKAFAIIQQYKKDGLFVVWPKKYAMRDPKLPMPTWEARKKK